MPEVKLRNIGKRVVSAKYKGRDGSPARVDGKPVWESNQPELVTVTPAADGLSAVIAGTGALPDDPATVVTVSCTADVNLGAGVKPITSTFDVLVEDANANLAEFEFGEESDAEFGVGLSVDQPQVDQPPQVDQSGQ